MSSRYQVCLVTEELFPFTAGGIGRVLHNLMLDSIRRDVAVDFHLLLAAPFAIEDAKIREHFGGKVLIHRIASESSGARWLQGTLYPPPTAHRACRSHSRSYQVLMKLKDLAFGDVNFDAIEFPDYGGLGFCALQEKHLGLAFGQTEMVVRIHSTEGVLQAVEDWFLSTERLGLFDLERKALLDADRVIAHLPQTGPFNAAYYGFPASWLDKVEVQFPPVVLGDPRRPEPLRADRPLVFASRVQQIKRPDLFVRGAARFMVDVPEYRGQAVLACGIPDKSYGEMISALVPNALKDRFVFLPEPGRERQRLIESGIVGITSSYESLNLLAYEVSTAGGSLVLNGSCLAFGPGTPFVDGRNCHKFNGTAGDLARAFENSWRWPAPERVSWRADPPYWESPSRSKVMPRTGSNGRGRVSVIVTHEGRGWEVLRCIESIADSSYTDLEVVLVGQAADGEGGEGPLDRIAEAGERWSCDVKVIRSPLRMGLGEARNLGVASAKGDFVLCLRSEDVLSPTFLELGANALDRRREFDAIIPSVARFESEEELYQGVFVDYDWFLGDAPALGLSANHLGRCGLIRRSVFDRFCYDPVIGWEEDWDFYLRLAHAGVRMLVTPSVQLYRPARQEKGPAPEVRRMLQARMLRSLPQSPRTSELFALLVPNEEVEGRSWKGPTELRPLRHELVDRLNRSVGAFPWSPKTALVRYEWVDTLNQMLKRNGRVHSVLRRVFR